MVARLREKFTALLLRKVPRSAIAPIVLIVSLLVTAWVWHAVRAGLHREDQAKFSAEVDAALIESLTKIHQYLGTLQGGTGLFASSKSVERHEWRQYVGQLDVATMYPSISGIGFVELVSDEELPRFAAETRFFAPNLQLDFAEKGPHYLMKFAEPEAEYLQFVGSNLATDPKLLEALFQARDQGKASIVKGSSLFQSLQGSPELVLVIPVYANGTAIAEVSQRQIAIVGWLVAVLKQGSFFRELSDVDRSGIALEIFDGSDTNNDALLTVLSPREGALTGTPEFVDTRQLEIGTRNWTLRFRALPEFFGTSTRIGPTITLACGMLISILLYAVIQSLVKTEQLAIALAQRMTAALRESEQRFRSMANTAPVLIWTAEADRTFDYINQVWLEFTGRTSDQELGRGWLEAVHPDERARVSEQYNEAFDSKEDFEIEFNLKRRDGIYRWMICKGTPRFLPNGSLAGYVGTCTDVTARKQAEEELRRAKEDAEDVSSLKTEFLSSIGQSARTLLDGIVETSSLALEEEVNTGHRENLLVVKDCATELLSVMHDILDFVLLEAGQLPVDHSGFKLSNSLRSIGRLVEAQAGKKRQQLLVHIAPDVPDNMVGDPVRLRQVLINLLANAVTFTPELGGIILRVNKVTDPNGSLRLNFTVANSGSGIAKEKREFLFESFSEVDDSGKGRRARGLGLPIAKRMVEEMGGDIRVDTKEGIGTAFHFSAKFEEASGATESAASPEVSFATDGEAPLNVLLVDDNTVAQKLASRLLEKRGHQVQVVTNGQEAIEQLEKGHFDLVLMDLQMPVMDGIEATRQIRASNKSYSEVPIVALAPPAVPEDEERCYDVGMNGYLKKPMDFTALTAVLKRFSGKGASSR